jgi:hypothetical protein
MIDGFTAAEWFPQQAFSQHSQIILGTRGGGCVISQESNNENK